MCLVWAAISVHSVSVNNSRWKTTAENKIKIYIQGNIIETVLQRRLGCVMCISNQITEMHTKLPVNEIQMKDFKSKLQSNRLKIIQIRHCKWFTNNIGTGNLTFPTQLLLCYTSLISFIVEFLFVIRESVWETHSGLKKSSCLFICSMNVRHQLKQNLSLYVAIIYPPRGKENGLQEPDTISNCKMKEKMHNSFLCPTYTLLCCRSSWPWHPSCPSGHSLGTRCKALTFIITKLWHLFPSYLLHFRMNLSGTTSQSKRKANMSHQSIKWKIILE